MTSLTKIPWKKSIWFSDVDDTLVDTDKTSVEAADGIKKVFEKKYGSEIANKTKEEFIQIYKTMVASIRNKTDADWAKSQIPKADFEKVWNLLETYQKEIIQKWGNLKKFSREVFLKICADRLKLSIPTEILYEAVDTYWLELSKKTTVLPGVLELTQQIEKHKRPLYLFTGSDCRLTLNENGQFEYDPKISEDFKRGRVQLLREKGINFNLVSVGDPEDKPHVDFFQKGIKLAEEDLRQKIDLTNAIMVGDAYVADLETPKNILNFGLVVLFEKGRIKTEIIDEHQITTGNLAEVANYLI